MKLENLLIINNTSVDGGGIKVCCESDVEIINVTVVNNIATAYGGGGIRIDNKLTKGIKNCIVWNNFPDGIFLHSTVDSLDVSYSNIQETWEGDGNLNSDPFFANILNDDYHLTDSSPCIGAATIENAPIFDLHGKLRPNPEGSNPDMGVFEHGYGFPKMRFDTNICVSDTLHLAYYGKVGNGIKLG